MPAILKKPQPCLAALLAAKPRGAESCLNPVLLCPLCSLCGLYSIKEDWEAGSQKISLFLSPEFLSGVISRNSEFVSPRRACFPPNTSPFFRAGLIIAKRSSFNGARLESGNSDFICRTTLSFARISVENHASGSRLPLRGFLRFTGS